MWVHTQVMAEDRSVLHRPGPRPDETLAYGAHEDQVIDVYVPPSTTRHKPRVVVFIHGGYWRPDYDRMHARSAAGALAQAGWVTALPEYRRFPGDPDASVIDVIEAVRYFASAPGNSSVLLMGHSAGGHLALIAASHPELPIHGTVVLAPVSDLQLAEDLDLDDGAVRSYLGCAARERRDLDPLQLPAPLSSLSIIHGLEDSIVPPHMSETYGRHIGVDVVALPKTGHYEPIDPLSETWDVVLQHVGVIDSRCREIRSDAQRDV